MAEGKRFEISLKPMFMLADTEKEAVLKYRMMLSQHLFTELIEVREVEDGRG